VRATLADADLDGTRLVGAKVHGANLRHAYVSDAAFDGVIYDEETRWPERFEPPPSGSR
jgi:uncharacterized protein YjbI with pentapeptide repeats